uniref:MLLT3 super elongation complex subunit n=1 Tax=Rhinolophus ferrumequinum TaxID=59479 RepID=A0A671EG99_RHIFE
MASSCAVQVKLELGHRAQVRKKPTVEGFTHDWMVFVRGPEHSNIQHFVEKVVFHLHESFPRPKRDADDGFLGNKNTWAANGLGWLECSAHNTRVAGSIPTWASGAAPSTTRLKTTT